MGESVAEHASLLSVNQLMHSDLGSQRLDNVLRRHHRRLPWEDFLRQDAVYLGIGISTAVLDHGQFIVGIRRPAARDG